MVDFVRKYSESLNMHEIFADLETRRGSKRWDV